MSDEQPRKKAESGGAPAWMGTFADLMSLLMCFFVLLLSFAEMDVQKFKQIAASMKMAFGVQRDIPAEDIPLGTSVIAQEFSPGKPTDTITDDVRQQTMEEEKQTLEFTDALVDEPDAFDEQDAGSAADMRDQVDEQTAEDAEKLKKALEEEIAEGMIQVEAKGSTIVIRIREKGSFPSGLARFSPDFTTVLDKLETTLTDVDGRIVVAGHTDDVPIRTSRFRSNWDLSSARAVSVVHELLDAGRLELERFMVEGHGEARPLVPNDTPENRALNRRVELTIIQGEPEKPKPFAVLKLDEDLSATKAAGIARGAAEALPANGSATGPAESSDEAAQEATPDRG